VVDEREGRIGGESVRLLSQNEAPVWECEVCGEDASWICTFCMYERQNPFYCELHSEDHDCDEPEMLLPVVNSPRMGMCDYTGPLFRRFTGERRSWPSSGYDSLRSARRRSGRSERS
jgi:hypothetical protein